MTHTTVQVSLRPSDRIGRITQQKKLVHQHSDASIAHTLQLSLFISIRFWIEKKIDRKTNNEAKFANDNLVSNILQYEFQSDLVMRWRLIR